MRKVSVMKNLAIAMLIFVLGGLVPAYAGETTCVNPEENLNLSYSAMQGDQSALAILQKKNTGKDFCAKYSVGVIYAARQREIEGEKLKNEALVEYKAAAENGDTEAQHFVGQYAWYVKRDMKSYLKWELLAAKGGHAEAQRELGAYYAFNGVEEDRDEAKGLRFLNQSAAQGNERAMFELGSFYDQFEGKNNDFVTAAKWYSRSAEKGFKASYPNLADMYAKGEGLPQSWYNSYFWGCLAVECFANRKPYVAGMQMSSPPGRSDNDLLVAKEHLSQQELAEITIQASQWKPGMPIPTKPPGFFQKIWCALQTNCRT